MEKIDIHNSDIEYKDALNRLQKDVSSKNYQLITDFLEASSIGKTARKNAHKKQVGVRARTKNIYLLKAVVKFLNKDLDKVNVLDMEKLIKALNENKIKKLTGQNYSEQTKSNMKITFILFLRYIIKDPLKFAALTDWIETSFKRKEIPSLSEDAVRKIISKCNTTQQKVLVATLFDSGARIEEFLNIRLSDIIEVKGDIPYYKLTLREEFSKTKGRTIGLFWKPTTDIMRLWLEEHPTKNELNSQFFPSTYGGVRKVLFKVGKRALGKSINPHLFRHSSATYYAGLGTDYFQLCKRYGWTIGSNMPNKYIDASGIRENETAKKFIDTNIKDLNEKLEKSERQRIMEKDKSDKRLQEFESELQSMKEMLAQLKNSRK